jgi:hypothetical protein
MDRIFGTNKRPKGTLMRDFVPLNQTGDKYGFNVSLRVASLFIQCLVCHSI